VKKGGYAFETNTKRSKIHSCSWRATIKCMKDLLKYQKTTPENLADK